MAPRIQVQRADAPRRSAAPKGYVASTYSALTSPENASVVRSVVIFGVCLVAFRLSFFLTVRDKIFGENGG